MTAPALKRMRRLGRRVLGRFFGGAQSNTREDNLRTWSEHDWSRLGEEWSNDPEWKASVVRHILEPNVPPGSRVLEIGPGGGRWTEHLLERASKLSVVDLAPKCIELCKERFRDRDNIEYFVNDGRSLGFLGPLSIDRVWSWDVFVHIRSDDVREYIREIARVLRPGGRAVIHHAKNGPSELGWRSDMSARKMRWYCEENALEVMAQFDSWDEGRFRIWPNLHPGQELDVVSIFAKPGW